MSEVLLTLQRIANRLEKDGDIGASEAMAIRQAMLALKLKDICTVIHYSRVAMNGEKVKEMLYKMDDFYRDNYGAKHETMTLNADDSERFVDAVFGQTVLDNTKDKD